MSKVFAVYMCYGSREVQECETWDEAVYFLYWGGEEGSLSPLEITDGDRVINREEFDRLEEDIWHNCYKTQDYIDASCEEETLQLEEGTPDGSI